MVFNGGIPGTKLPKSDGSKSSVPLSGKGAGVSTYVIK